MNVGCWENLPIMPVITEDIVIIQPCLMGAVAEVAHERLKAERFVADVHENIGPAVKRACLAAIE